MTQPHSANPNIYKVAFASIVGSVIEQYDFLVTGVIAATVWGGVFFKLPALAAAAQNGEDTNGASEPHTGCCLC